ncbi:MAG: D-2-hydroxyacid dehydrogenase [Myxococcota bacterium]|nr:D-2-hydroxyacid dehydrogenase [Myxococcota bacterium]
MKIVILDGYTLNPGDNPWDILKPFGDLVIYDRTPDELIASRASGAQVVLTNKTPITGDTLRHLPALKYIGVLATGYNVVDIAACRERGVVVCNVPEYGTAAVAQYVFALMLELAHRVGQHAEAVNSGGWSRSGEFSFWETPQRELSGLTLGILGYGRIGRRVATLGEAFGMQVQVTTRTQPHEATVTTVELPDLLATSDVLTLHCPSTPETRGIISRANLARMKSDAFLINTARGDLVDEAALADALDQNKLGGAALDVVAAEPISDDHRLLGHPSCIITPHMAWSALEARQRLMQTTRDNLAAFIRNEPQNDVTAL